LRARRADTEFHEAGFPLAPAQQDPDSGLTKGVRCAPSRIALEERYATGAAGKNRGGRRCRVACS
jgi:hypothetical protein